MKILFVAATELELAAIQNIPASRHQTEFLVSGIGMVATTYAITKRLANSSYDLLIQIGIAGSFDRQLKIGEVVHVTEEIFSELGAEDGGNFLSLRQMGLDGIDKLIVSNKKQFPFEIAFKNVRGITVNTTHGNQFRIDEITRRLQPQVESMEGGACLFVCQKENTDVIQLRAISNYVERRNKDAWNIPLAVKNLGDAVSLLLNSLP